MFSSICVVSLVVMGSQVTPAAPQATRNNTHTYMKDTNENIALKDLINKELKNTWIDKTILVVQVITGLFGMSFISYVGYHCLMVLIHGIW
jgi:hypothetical protein